MKYYINVVEVAIEHKSKILVIKRGFGRHAEGMLSFPGGKVEEIDEKNSWDILKEAAKREIFEELGLELLDELEYIVTNHFVDDYNTHIIDTIFYCKIDKTSLNIIPSKGEILDYYWMSSEEILSGKNNPEWLKKYIKFIIDKKS